MLVYLIYKIFLIFLMKLSWKVNIDLLTFLSNTLIVMKKHRLWLFMSLTFNACFNDEEFTNKVDVPPLPRAVNGRLYFETPQAYLHFIDNTINSDIEKIVDGIPGFKSLRVSNLEKLMSYPGFRVTDDFEELMEDVTDDVIWDPYFQNLLNEDRELRILDQIYRITEFGTFFYEGEELKGRMDELHAELTRGRFALYGCGDQPILVEPDIYFLPGSDCDGIGGYYGGSGGGNSSPPPPQNGPCGLSPNSKTRAGSNKNIFGVNHTETLYLTGTTDRRIKARFWSQNYAIFSSVGTNTRSQNKWADIWWAERADDIYLKYEGQIEQKDAFNNLISFEVESVPPLREKNENKLSTTFQWASAIVGNACDPVTGKCKGKFKPAPPFKIKKLETCHYVLDEGRHGEIRLLYQ